LVSPAQGGEARSVDNGPVGRASRRAGPKAVQVTSRVAGGVETVHAPDPPSDTTRPAPSGTLGRVDVDTVAPGRAARPRPHDPAGARPLPGPVAGLAATVAGVGLLLAFPPYGWWWLAPVAVALLAVAVHRRRLRAGAGLGALTGAVFFVPL